MYHYKKKSYHYSLEEHNRTQSPYNVSFTIAQIKSEYCIKIQSNRETWSIAKSKHNRVTDYKMAQMLKQQTGIL